MREIGELTVPIQTSIIPRIKLNGSVTYDEQLISHLTVFQSNEKNELALRFKFLGIF